MRSSRARKLLNAYLEGDLDSEARDGVEHALERDPELRRELREIEATVALLRGLRQPEAPPALTAQVMERVRSGEAEPARFLGGLRRMLEPMVWLPAVTAAVALAVLVGAFDLGERAGDAPLVLAGASDPVDQLRKQRELVRGMRQLRFERLERRGQRHEVTRILRGAGHPHSASLASHLEGEGDNVFAFASLSGP
jgi:anti-sigma factor RsiW